MGDANWPIIESQMETAHYQRLLHGLLDLIHAHITKSLAWREYGYFNTAKTGTGVCSVMAVLKA